MNDLTILVQGPLAQDSLDHIEEYKQHGKVIVVYWDNADQTLIDKLDAIPDITTISLEEPSNEVIEAYNTVYVKTFFKAITSMTFGFRECNTQYVLKVRSDEFYNLKPIIKKFESHQCKKIVFGNIFYKEYMYHIGDHIFIGPTDILYKAVKRIYDFHRRQLTTELNPWFNIQDGPGNCAEIILCKSILCELGCSVLNQTNLVRGFILEHFDVIDINLMAPFRARWVQANQVYENKFNMCIKNIEQIVTNA